MGLRTPLYETHVAAGARTVDFGGWDMPVNYGSQIEEHHAVRRDAGMFDVSHMCVVDLRGERVRDYLRHLLANDVSKLAAPGKALYSCMLRVDGGVIDDLIVYYMNDRWYRLVVNAGTRDKDLAWLRQVATGFGVAVEPRTDLALIAVQGPNARVKAASVMAADAARRALELGTFFGSESGSLFIARTGYTGEDGFEIMLPADQAVAFWNSLRAAGVAPCGLGARDTLRLEAGMNLYGNDMDETTSPSSPASAGRLPGNRRTATSSAARRSRRRSRPAWRASWSACSSRIAPCCDRTRKCSSPTSATAKSPAARSRPPCSVRSASRACRRAPAIAARLKSAASWCRRASCACLLSATARPPSPCSTPAAASRIRPGLRLKIHLTEDPVMSNVPADLRFQKSHEWARLEADGTITIGISDHAQQALGDLVFVEAPEAGRRVNAGEACAVVESVKAASDVYSPVSGEVVAGNVDLGGQPELINQDPYGAGWIMRVRPDDKAQFASMLDATAYSAALAAETH